MKPVPAHILAVFPNATPEEYAAWSKAWNDYLDNFVKQRILKKLNESLPPVPPPS
jgi:hypothetical protein